MVHEVRYVSSATRLQQCPTKRPFDQAAQMVVLSPKHANPSRVAATVWNCSYSQCSRLLGRVVSVEFPMIFSLFIPRHHLLPNIFAIILEVFRKPEATGKTQRGAPPMWGCRGCDRLGELPCSFEELQGVELAAYPGYPVYTMPGMRRWQCSLSAFPACPSSRPTPSTRRGDPADQTMRCCPTASSLFMALDCWNSVQCDLWVRICILVVWKLVNQKVNAFLTQKTWKKSSLGQLISVLDPYKVNILGFSPPGVSTWTHTCAPWPQTNMTAGEVQKCNCLGHDQSLSRPWNLLQSTLPAPWQDHTFCKITENHHGACAGKPIISHHLEWGPFYFEFGGPNLKLPFSIIFPLNQPSGHLLFWEIFVQGLSNSWHGRSRIWPGLGRGLHP